MPFKPGDLVVCIDNSNHDSTHPLTLYRVYTVTRSDSVYTRIRDDEGFERNYLTRRFKLTNRTRVRKGYAKFANEKIPITTSTPTVNA